MSLHKVSEAKGPVLDYMVSLTTNPQWETEDRILNLQDMGDEEGAYCPSENHGQGGPVLEKERICTSTNERGGWMAWIYDGLEMTFIQHGSTPLIAGMRCLVCRDFGDEFGVPDEIN